MVIIILVVVVTNHLSKRKTFYEKFSQKHLFHMNSNSVIFFGLEGDYFKGSGPSVIGGDPDFLVHSNSNILRSRYRSEVGQLFPRRYDPLGPLRAAHPTKKYLHT